MASEHAEAASAGAPESTGKRATRPINMRALAGTLVIGLVFIVLFVLVVVPFLMIVITSFATDVPFSGTDGVHGTLANYRELWTAEFAEAVVNTLIVSAGGTAISVSIGCTLAWLAARTDIPCKPLVHLAGVMPLFVSLVVASVTWSFLGSGRSGYLNILFASWALPFRVETQSLAGITFVHGLYYVPYPFIFVYGALALMHADLEQAAATHGANLVRVLRRITLPLITPALISSALLCFVAMAEEFPVPAILGGHVGIETLSTRIYKLMTRVPGQPGQAAALSVLLTAIVCVLVYTQRRALRGKDFRTVTGKGMPARFIRLRKLKWLAVGFVGLYGFVALGLPILALLLGAMRSSIYVPDIYALFDPRQLTLRHLADAIEDPAVQEGLKNSLIAGVATAICGTVLCFCVSYLSGRTTLRGRQLLEYIAMVPLALPSLVMGSGILWTWLAVPLPIYGTMAILVIAFTARFLPQGVRSISSSISQIHTDLEEAAMVAGASKYQAVRRITLPLMKTAVVSTAFLLIVLSTRELTASLLLYTTNTRVLSIVIFESYEQGVWSTVASVSLIYTALLVVLTLVGRRWMRAQF